MQYVIGIEQAENNYSAYVPDFPGCIATGQTTEDVTREIQAAIQFHLEGLRAEGLPIPPAISEVRMVEAAGL
jgi:predicted RNase H-like HicB family nuclease